MLCSMAFTACTPSVEDSEDDETTLDETTIDGSSSETTIDESSSKTTEDSSEEETTVIVDVMIGETLDAEPAADFTVSKVFSDYMVVQRGEHIRVWGFAPESENGKKVSGEFKGMFAEAIIENGE